MEVAEEKVFEDNNDDVRHGETAEEVQEDEADGGSMEEGSRRYSEEKLAQIGSTISTEDIEVVVKAESKIIAGGVDVDGAEEKTVMHLSESKDEAKKYQAKAGEESPMNKARTRRRWQMSSTEEKAEEKARENKAEQKDEQAEIFSLSATVNPHRIGSTSCYGLRPTRAKVPCTGFLACSNLWPLARSVLWCWGWKL